MNKNACNRKKICFIVTSPLIVDFFLRPHLNALAVLCDVTLLVSSIEDRYVNLNNIPVQIVYIPIARKVDVINDIRALWAIIKILTAGRYCLVQTVAPKAGLLGMVAAKICKIRLRVHYFQGEVWANKSGLSRFILKSCDKITAFCASHVLAVSHSESRFLFSENVTRRAPPVVLGHGSICGVDINHYKPDSNLRALYRDRCNIADDDIVCLFVGRLCRDKGVHDLLRAWVALKGNFPELHLVFLGPDEENVIPELKMLACGFESTLHFYGYTDDPAPFYASADFLCLPSYREGLGMVILEASAMGVPAIGSAIHGISDALVSDKTGLLFKAGDVNHLADKISKMCNDADFRRQLGLAGRARIIEDFEQGYVVKNYTMFVSGLLEPRGN